MERISTLVTEKKKLKAENLKQMKAELIGVDCDLGADESFCISEEDDSDASLSSERMIGTNFVLNTHSVTFL